MPGLIVVFMLCLDDLPGRPTLFKKETEDASGRVGRWRRETGKEGRKVKL